MSTIELRKVPSMDLERMRLRLQERFGLEELVTWYHEACGGPLSLRSVRSLSHYMATIEREVRRRNRQALKAVREGMN